jgi:hypothetical protein
MKQTFERRIYSQRKTFPCFPSSLRLGGFASLRFRAFDAAFFGAKAL